MNMPRRTDFRTNRRARGIEWAVGIAAATLLLVSLGGYLYHREQLAAVTTEHLRLRVCAPPSLGIDRPAEFHVLTTEIGGKPVPAQVEIGLLAADGIPIMHSTDRTAADGLLRMAVTLHEGLPEKHVRLEVTAGRNGSQENFQTQIATEPARYVTCLATDRPSYRPGDTAFFRSVTLDRCALHAAPDLRVKFELEAADGRILPQSPHETTTSHGVANGTFAIPADLPSGRYTLVGRSPERLFPPVRLPVSIGDDTGPETEAESETEASADVRVTFHPEGGALVPDVENRVYFTARNARGEPVELKGLIVDADDTPVALVETIHRGMGAFSVRPRPDGGYRLSIAEPKDTETEPELPDPDIDRNVAISAGVGVFGAGRPIDVNLRAARDGVPLVVTAWCRGVFVGQEPIVTRVLGDDEPQEGLQGAGGINQVTLTIPEEVGGLIRLIVYDYSTNPPSPVAQRWVYRRRARRLNIEAATDIRRTASGKQAVVALTVTDESGNPASAVLAVSAVDKAIADSAGNPGVSLPGCFLYSSGVDVLIRPGHAALDVSDEVEPDVGLDLLMGTHGKRPETEAEEAEAKFDTWPVSAPPPVVFDNLQPLRQEYQQALEQYRRDRTYALNTLTTLSFFGGLGLVLAVAMLGLLGVVAGLRLWIPAIATAVCCLLIGAVLLAPLRSEAHLQSGTAFLSFEGSVPREEAVPEESAPERPQPPPPTIHRYAYEADKKDLVDWGKWGGTLFWDPLLSVNDDGRAEIHFDLPDTTEDICLRVEAHAAGRLGEVQTCPGNADPIY